MWLPRFRSGYHVFDVVTTFSTSENLACYRGRKTSNEFSGPRFGLKCFLRNVKAVLVCTCDLGASEGLLRTDLPNNLQQWVSSNCAHGVETIGRFRF